MTHLSFGTNFGSLELLAAEYGLCCTYTPLNFLTFFSISNVFINIHEYAN